MKVEKLKTCQLYRNNIGADESKHLTKANWRQLSVIWLSNNLYKKVETLLERKESVIFQE
jgi:hypothetical protein